MIKPESYLYAGKFDEGNYWDRLWRFEQQYNRRYLDRQDREQTRNYTYGKQRVSPKEFELRPSLQGVIGKARGRPSKAGDG